MTGFEIVSVVALGLGALYGLACLINPRFAAASVRLQADPDRPGGYAEFRATLGGVFFGLHAAAIGGLVGVFGASTTFGALVVAMGWGGAAVGRLLAILLDRDQAINPAYNLRLIGLELVFALAIAAPVLHA